jgi:hypothetical protein
MSTDLIAQIRAISAKVNDGRNYMDVFHSGCQEFDELSGEMHKAVLSKPPGEDGVAGESADVILCMLDLIFQAAPDMTDEDIYRLLMRKAEKWVRKYSFPIDGVVQRI